MILYVMNMYMLTYMDIACCQSDVLAVLYNFAALRHIDDRYLMENRYICLRYDVLLVSGTISPGHGLTGTDLLDGHGHGILLVNDCCIDFLCHIIHLLF